MNSRERQLAAIRRELTDRISVDAICIENVPQIAQWLGIAEDAVLDRLGVDGRIVAAPCTGRIREGFDEWGSAGDWKFHERREYPLAGAGSVAEVERYPWPSADDYDYAAAARQAKPVAGRYALRGPYWMPLFCRVCDLMGMEEAMVKMATAPAVFEAALEAVFQHAIQYVRRLLDAFGADLPILCLGDDFATQRGMMISPADWRRFLKGRYARLFEAGKSTGRFVWFHSCGDVTPVLGDLIDIGADVWETVQLHALPMSGRELKKQFGRRLTFFGGVNTQRLPFATVPEVRQMTRRAIEALGPGGGYICGPDHHIKPDVPPANAVALFEEAASFRGNGITN